MLTLVLTAACFHLKIIKLPKNYQSTSLPYNFHQLYPYNQSCFKSKRAKHLPLSLSWFLPLVESLIGIVHGKSLLYAMNVLESVPLLLPPHPFQPPGKILNDQNLIKLLIAIFIAHYTLKFLLFRKHKYLTVTVPQNLKTNEVCCSWRTVFAVFLTQPPYLLYKVNTHLKRRMARQNALKANLLNINKLLLTQKVSLVPHFVWSKSVHSLLSALGMLLVVKKQAMSWCWEGIPTKAKVIHNHLLDALGKKRHLSIHFREHLNKLTFNFNWQTAQIVKKILWIPQIRTGLQWVVVSNSSLLHSVQGRGHAEMKCNQTPFKWASG